MKKIINKPEDIVAEMCQGIVLTNPDLVFLPHDKIIKKREIKSNKVTLISGGGSGHEPAHAGFIGKGMLDAAVCGDIFASPSQIQIYHAIKETQSDKGTLLIVKNYSGDLMNFKNAAFLAKTEGINVDYVVVSDDIAVENSLYTVGKRGVAGTVFVHKIAGSAAEAGLSLEEVKKIAIKTVDNVKTIGFALSSCTVPAKGTPTFHLEDNKMEYGVGIHGEPGRYNGNYLSSKEISKKIITDLSKELKLDSRNKQSIALLINGFGSTPLMELYVLANNIFQYIYEYNIEVERVFVGNYMTSIDMLGASVSILTLDEELKKHLNSPNDIPCFQVNGSFQHKIVYPFVEKLNNTESINYNYLSDPKVKNHLSYKNIVFILETMCSTVITNEVKFCELDSHAGDGDFGMSLSKGFKQLKKQLPKLVTESKDIGTLLDKCSLIIMEYCGGASGPIWGGAFKYAGNACLGKTELSSKDIALILDSAMKGIQDIGKYSFGRGAQVGDKTLIDALAPCVFSWHQSVSKGDNLKSAFHTAAQAAMKGAENTKNFAAKMGRAGVVGDRSIGFADAGALGLGIIFLTISDLLQFEE